MDWRELIRGCTWNTHIINQIAFHPRSKVCHGETISSEFFYRSNVRAGRWARDMVSACVVIFALKCRHEWLFAGTALLWNGHRW